MPASAVRFVFPGASSHVAKIGMALMCWCSGASTRQVGAKTSAMKYTMQLRAMKADAAMVGSVTT